MVLLDAVHELDDDLAVGPGVHGEQPRATAEVNLASETEALPEEPLPRPSECRERAARAQDLDAIVSTVSLVSLVSTVSLVSIVGPVSIVST